MSTKHFNLGFDLDVNNIERLNAARALADQPAIDPFAAFAVLNGIPRTDQLRAQLATEVLSAEDPDAWMQDAVERMQQTLAAEQVRIALGQSQDRLIRANREKWTTDTVALISESVTSVITSLSDAAADLPEDPLDLGAVVATHSTRAMETAISALTELGTYANIYGNPANSRLQGAGELPAIVDVPSVGPARFHPTLRKVANPDEDRDHMRRMHGDLQRHGIDAVLIRVARGDYGDNITISLPASRQEWGVRIGRLAAALEDRSDGHLMPPPEGFVERQTFTAPRPGGDDGVTFAGRLRLTPEG